MTQNAQRVIKGYDFASPLNQLPKKPSSSDQATYKDPLENVLMTSNRKVKSPQSTSSKQHPTQNQESPGTMLLSSQTLPKVSNKVLMAGMQVVEGYGSEKSSASRLYTKRNSERKATYNPSLKNQETSTENMSKFMDSGMQDSISTKCTQASFQAYQFAIQQSQSTHPQQFQDRKNKKRGTVTFPIQKSPERKVKDMNEFFDNENPFEDFRTPDDPIVALNQGLLDRQQEHAKKAKKTNFVKQNQQKVLMMGQSKLFSEQFQKVSNGKGVGQIGMPKNNDYMVKEGPMNARLPPLPKHMQEKIKETKSKSSVEQRSINKQPSKSSKYGQRASLVSSGNKFESQRHISSNNYGYGSTSTSIKNNKPQKQQKNYSAPLLLFDQNLSFLQEEITMNAGFEFNGDKLDNMDCIFSTGTIVNADREMMLFKAKVIIVFIKLSPRLKEKSLKILQELAKSRTIIVIKCAPANETVDLFIEYEKTQTVEQRKQNEHTIFLSQESFDSFSISAPVLKDAIEFIQAKVENISKK